MCGRFQYGCSKIARQTSHNTLMFNSVNNLYGFLRLSTAKIQHKEVITHHFDFYTTQKTLIFPSIASLPPPQANFYKCHVTGLDLGYTSLGHGHYTPSFS